MSQPALSTQVRKLEAFLGVTVFERLPGRVLVTERGHAVLDAARSVLERAEALMAVAHAGAAPLAGPFRHQAGAPCCWPIETGDGRLILLEEGHCLRDQARALCGVPAGSAERLAVGLEMLRHMVAAGEGTSLAPALATAALGDMGGAVAYTPVGDPGVGRDIALVVRRSDPRETDLLALAALLRQLAPSPGGVD